MISSRLQARLAHVGIDHTPIALDKRIARENGRSRRARCKPLIVDATSFSGRLRIAR
jgi:hypothetical protein